VLLEKNGIPEKEPEGQALQTRAYSRAEELLRRHEASVARVANRLLQPPHKLDPEQFVPTGQAREGYADRAGAGRVAFCGLGGMSRWPPSSRCELHNGLLLSALWDAAFDQGLVSFADDGAVLAGPQLSEAARKTLGVDAALPLRGLRDAHRANLGMHRARHPTPPSLASVAAPARGNCGWLRQLGRREGGSAR
jgi:hypothetical protein